MADLIAEALSVSRPRIATGPSRGARQRRVREKRHRSDVKQTRRPVRGEHDT